MIKDVIKVLHLGGRGKERFNFKCNEMKLWYQINIWLICKVTLKTGSKRNFWNALHFGKILEYVA